MKINATFITSVASADKFLKTDKPIIAVAGKSNVGKSSLINMLANQNKLAKTSVTPGRTRLINYFDFGEFILADLPGYGFAKVSKEEKAKWGKLMDRFFADVPLDHLFILVDIRHNPTGEDQGMVEYAYHYRLPFSLIATKADKLGKSKIKPQAFKVAADLKVGAGDITPVSSETGYGKDKLIAELEKVVLLHNEKKAEQNIQNLETEN